MRRRSWKVAETKIGKGAAPVYLYLLEWKSGAQDGMIMAGHGLCVPLTMDNTARSGSWTADFPDSGIVAAAMSEAWIAFAKTGDPSAKGYAAWPSYNLKNRETMIFNVHSQALSNPHGEQDIWQGIPELPFGTFTVPGSTGSPLEKVLKPSQKKQG
jgi:para-nitrobenzyl esterase